MFFSGLLFVIITGLINIGIIAMDDYFDVVAKIIPAQEVSFSGILDARGLHSPLPALILAVFSKLALKFGLLEPIAQLRFVLVVIGFVSFLIHSLLGLTVFKKSIRESDVFLFFVGFHFLAPLFFTRAMVETLSAPCVSLSVLFVWKSIQNKTRTSLFLSAVFALCAFQLRYQTFAIVPGILLTLILHKKFKETYFYLLSLGLGLVLSGLFEKLLTGEFFGIARPYFEYNLQHSSGHGVTPFYTFILLFLGMALFPFWADAIGAPYALGFFYSSITIGAVIVTLMSGWMRNYPHHGRAVVVGALGWGVAIVVAGTTDSLYVVIGSLIIAGAFDQVSALFRGFIWNQSILK
ncbi:MAG: hypothetical protein EBR01_09965, partial [Proteobacteria bacterium]|nr:hypothetical protein [Pseudomonadota bacterium]